MVPTPDQDTELAERKALAVRFLRRRGPALRADGVLRKGPRRGPGVRRSKMAGGGRGISSYVYMKILESQPRRYDRGIALLSLGRSSRMTRRLVEDNIRQGTAVLDVGCGTGSAALLAARAGARVIGFDHSGGMLAVARAKVEAAGLADRIELIEMGISGMDRFAVESFDVVLSTLVFSELSPDERSYALRHTRRVLRRGGRLAITDEVPPVALSKRMLHGALRLPLLAVTFALTQTSTRPVEGLPDLVRAAGFRVELEERTALESLLYLVASKGGRA